MAGLVAMATVWEQTIHTHTLLEGRVQKQVWVGGQAMLGPSEASKLVLGVPVYRPLTLRRGLGAG